MVSEKSEVAALPEESGEISKRIKNGEHLSKTGKIFWQVIFFLAISLVTLICEIFNKIKKEQW